MPYIDTTLLLTDEKTHTLPNGYGKASGNVVVFVDDIEKLPAADVVPRAEIEKIFEEIERLLDNYHSACLPVGTIEPYTYYEGDLGEAFAEFKKKYTEEQK